MTLSFNNNNNARIFSMLGNQNRIINRLVTQLAGSTKRVNATSHWSQSPIRGPRISSAPVRTSHPLQVRSIEACRLLGSSLFGSCPFVCLSVSLPHSKHHFYLDQKLCVVGCFQQEREKSTSAECIGAGVREREGRIQ